MELTQQQYEQVAELLLRQRGNVKVDNWTVLTAGSRPAGRLGT